MSKSEFLALVADRPELRIRRTRSRAIHVFSDFYALCSPGRNFGVLQDPPPSAGPTCVQCITAIRGSTAPQPITESLPNSIGMEPIFAIFGTACIYCEVDLRHPEISATKDHLIPRSKGGSDSPLNLVPACKTCNGEKANMLLEEYANGDYVFFGQVTERIQAGIDRFRIAVLNGGVTSIAHPMRYESPLPGQVLQNEYLKPLAISVKEIAVLCDVSPSTIRRLVHGQLRLSARMAVKLEKALGRPAHYWLQLQTSHDIQAAKLAEPNGTPGLSDSAVHAKTLALAV